MKSYILFTIILLISFICFMSSCTDKLADPSSSILDCSTTKITYVDHVKGILDANCNFSGCHDDNNQTSFGAYASLDQARMSTLYQRVCVAKNMPPAGMSAEKIDTIRCWSENGYLEN